MASARAFNIVSSFDQTTSIFMFQRSVAVGAGLCATTGLIYGRN